MAKFKFSKWWYLVGILLAANIAVWIAAAKFQNPDYAKLYFFDVGQGDAIYLRTPAGNDVLIDGGPGDVVLSKLGNVMPFADRTIELVILTHPHADHVSGLVEILKRYHIQEVMLPEVSYSSATYARFRELLQKQGIKTISPRLGQRIFLDSGVVFDVYYPVVGKFDTPPKDINDASMVGKLSFGQTNVLLTGDAGQDIEQLFLRFQLPLNAEILKIGHHGSRHSSAPEFLRAVAPAYSIISVGKNSYGHPSAEVLGLLQSQDDEVLRTDEAGDIVFRLYPDRVDRVR